MLLSAVKRSQTGPGLCKERRIGCFSGPSGLLDPLLVPGLAANQRGAEQKGEREHGGKKTPDVRYGVGSTLKLIMLAQHKMMGSV